jgi:DNA polymerase III subunit delta
VARARKDNEPRFDQVLADIDGGQTQPVYVFHGPNVTVIEQGIAKLKSKIVGDNEDFAYQVMRGDESSGAAIFDAARTLPMLAEQQLIIVRQADALTADDQAALLRYLEDPTPTTCLVLIASKIDKRLKLYSRASKLGFVHEASAITDRELGGWLTTRARDYGLTISPQTAHVLGEATGTDTATIEDALERLSLYVGARKEVTAHDVETIVTTSRVHSIFELTDALGRRDAASALRTLANMLQNREAPLRILATLATHMRRLLHAAELGDRLQHFELASELGVPPFLARKVAEQARKFSVQELRRALQRLAATDLELKGSKRPDALIMEEMLLDLCLGAPPASRASRGRHRSSRR